MRIPNRASRALQHFTLQGELSRQSFALQNNPRCDAKLRDRRPVCPTLTAQKPCMTALVVPPPKSSLSSVFYVKIDSTVRSLIPGIVNRL